jgi:poly(A) polymerase
MPSQNTLPSLRGAWLDHPATQQVLGLLEEAGHAAYLVGGTVRNALMGLPVTDLDASTDATPDRVIQLAKKKGLRVVPTGIDHGTVTVVVEGEPVEVTTFRRDVATDGRRAVVAFTQDLREDALRRDFTLNALYVDRHGNLVDPLGGYGDVMARRVRFIEDADRRLQEDYLRALRFFRFNARYAQGQPLDLTAVKAIARHLDGLSHISAERIGSELLKILSVTAPSDTVFAMADLGVLERILPGSDPQLLPALEAAERTLDLLPDPIRRLAALNISDGASLRLSKTQTKKLFFLHGQASATTTAEELAWREDAGIARDVVALRAAKGEQNPSNLGDLDAAEKAVFPIAAQDLMPALQGPALGAELKRLQAIWIASDFKLSAAELLSFPAGEKDVQPHV